MKRDLLELPVIQPGDIPPDQVAPDALEAIPPEQPNPKRGEGGTCRVFPRSE